MRRHLIASREVSFGEGAARVRFEIFLKIERLEFVWECAVPDEFPRLKFCGVARFAGVVFR